MSATSAVDHRPSSYLAGIERVLCIGAHPDDIDFGTSGTVAAWVDAGVEVTYCVITDGDAGGFDHDIARQDVPAIRRREQRDAAKIAGVNDVRYLGYTDGRLEMSFELRRDLARVIREVRPHRVLTQTPERNWERIAVSHPDHLVAGEATLRAVYPDARNPFAHPELLADGLAPWVVSEVWLSGHQEPDIYVDVSDTFDRKLQAILSHVSQIPDVAGLEDMLRSRMQEMAAKTGLAPGALAEAFKRVATL